MRLQEWEGTIQEIIAECGHEQKKADKILMAWRAKLEKEPTLLHPYQIDEIIREVRRKTRQLREMMANDTSRAANLFSPRNARTHRLRRGSA